MVAMLRGNNMHTLPFILRQEEVLSSQIELIWQCIHSSLMFEFYGPLNTFRVTLSWFTLNVKNNQISLCIRMIFFFARIYGIQRLCKPDQPVKFSIFICYALIFSHFSCNVSQTSCFEKSGKKKKKR